MKTLAISLAAALLLVAEAPAHPGHASATDPGKAAAPDATPGLAGSEATTGSGDLRFRLRPDLSELPEAIAGGIVRAHGGVAKAPDGSLYFGLVGTGVVRVSADLREKTLVSGRKELVEGGLHNATYLDQEGGVVVLPDNVLGRLLLLNLRTGEVASVGRPTVDPYYDDPAKPYRPTDADTDGAGTLFVCDGYAPSKLVLTVDLKTMTYGANNFGGPVPDRDRTPGRFSTNHGVTFDPEDGSLWIADRERQWVQRLTTSGDFLEGHDTGGANPCDVDFVQWRGDRLAVVGCLVSSAGGGGEAPGVVQLLRDGQVVSTLRPKVDLGVEEFQHIHNAVGVVVDGRLYVVCYGWNPGCYAVLEHVAEGG